MLNNFEQEYGRCVSSGETATPVNFLKTGVAGLDQFVLWQKGIPRSRITEIHGGFGSGKSTLALQIVAQTQKALPDEFVYFLDAEGRLDPDWAQRCGVNLARLKFVDFKHGEDLLDKVTSLVGLQVPLIVIDSVAGIVPHIMKDLDKLEDVNMRTNVARSQLLTTFCDRIAGGFSVPGDLKKSGAVTRLVHSGTALVFVNHWKERFKTQPWGPIPDGSIGGASLRYYSTLRLAFSKQSSKHEDRGLVRIHCRKSIICPPYRSAVFSINFKSGAMCLDSDWLVKYLIARRAVVRAPKRKLRIVKGPDNIMDMQGLERDVIEYLLEDADTRLAPLMDEASRAKPDAEDNASE